MIRAVVDTNSINSGENTGDAEGARGRQYLWAAQS